MKVNNDSTLVLSLKLFIIFSACNFPILPAPIIPTFSFLFIIILPPHLFYKLVFSLIYFLAFIAYSRGFAIDGSCSASTINHPS